MRRPFFTFVFLAWTAACAAAAQGTPTDLFRQGADAFHHGDYKTAHTAFARLVKLAPRIAAAHAAFGAVLLAEDDPHAAGAELAEAHRLDPHDTVSTANLAIAQTQLGNYPAALALFRELPEATLNQLQPSEVLAFATALNNTGDHAGAEARLRYALSAGSPSPELLDALGSIQAQQARFDDARTSFEAALQANPKYVPAHAHLGSFFLHADNPAAAIAELRLALALGGPDPVTEVQLGRALSASGQDAEAIAALRTALAAQPDSLDAQYALALALQAGGQSQEALPLFARVAAAHPASPAALINYGLALVQTGDAKTALALYSRAVALEPNNLALQEDMGVAFLQTNNVDHAITQFQAGLQLDPENAQLHYDLGLAFKLKDDLPKAIRELERAEALDPTLPDPPYTLGIIRMQQGNAGEAAAQFQRTVTLKPDNGGAWALLGNVEKDAGNLDAATAALQHAVALQPDQPSPHVTLAAILTARGDRDGAAKERKLAADLSRKAMSRQRAGFALQSGRALLAKGDLPGAILQLNDAIAAQPDLKEAHLLLAKALLKQGRSADALAERQRAEHLPGAAQSP